MKQLSDWDITTSELVAAVREVAADHPHTVVRICQYQDDDGEPCCIIGHALHRLDVTVDELAEFDSLNDGSGVPVVTIVNESWTDLSYDADIPGIPDLATQWLRYVQVAQDDLNEWAGAVAYADEMVPQL